MSIDKKHFTGAESEGGITSSYATDDGVKLRVPYSFMGSIYDDAERQAALEAMAQDSLTMGPKTQEFQKKFAKAHQVKHAFACSNCTTGMHVATQLFDIYNETDGLSRRKRVESGGRSRKTPLHIHPLSRCGGARS